MRVSLGSGQGRPTVIGSLQLTNAIPVTVAIPCLSWYCGLCFGDSTEVIHNCDRRPLITVILLPIPPGPG